MNTKQIQTEKLSGILNALLGFGCLVVIAASLVVMIGSTWDNPNLIVTHLHLGLLGSMLITIACTLLTALGYKPRPFPWGSIRSKVIEATDWSFLSPDTLLFATGKGEVSNLFLTEPMQLVISSPPPKAARDLGPGFIYVMRRTDGIYKLGRAVDPTQRLLDHKETYKQDFKLIRWFAVSDMVTFERLALTMTKSCAYKKEVGRRELRKMTRRQLGDFLADFEKMVRGDIKEAK